MATDPLIWGPVVAGEAMSKRLMRSLDYRLHPDMPRLTPEQVAVVMHALADHTAIQEALRYSVDHDGPWPFATSIGRWFHAIADQLESKP